MNIIQERIGEVFIITVNYDRATLNNADTMKQIVAEAVDKNIRKIVIDLSACEFIDSTFLGVLVSALKRVRQIDGELRLVGFKRAVSVMFDLTRMDKVFSVYKDLKEAVSSFPK